MWIIIVIFLVLLFSSIYVALQRMGGGNFPWIQFYARGKDAGFTFKEINLLRQVAVRNQLQNPTSLYWSIKQLDRSIKGAIIQYRRKGHEKHEDAVYFIAKLFEFRKQVEFNLPKYKLGLKSTRNIAVPQRLRIHVQDLGVYYSRVVENLRRHMAISYPEGPKTPPNFSWKNRYISIYFWRANDAGYVFDTKVIDDYYDRDYKILHISHSDNLIRSQKRGSVRVETSIRGMIYPLKSLATANDLPEKAAGLRCRVIDLSEDGAAVMVGGRAKVGMAIKIQFKISDSVVVMNGIVKGINFNEKQKQSVLHVKAAPLNPIMRNKVLVFVYDLFGEQKALSRAKKKETRPSTFS